MAVKFAALALSSLNLHGVSGVQQATGVQPPFWERWQMGGAASIPTIIWVTGEWASDSPEVQQIEQNLDDMSGLSPAAKSAQRGQALAERKFAKWAPIGTQIRYLTDDDMLHSISNVSRMLEDSDINKMMTKTAEHAFSNLRPSAYRSDLWRYLILWAYGGVYLDANLKLERPLTEWIDFDADKLVLVEDAGTPRCAYWNAMMAAAPQEPHLGKLIAGVANRIERHYYGPSSASITGPEAICSLFKIEGAAQYNDLINNHLRCDLQKVGTDDVRVIRGGGSQEVVMATKDETLHSLLDSSTDYKPMWESKAVYCDRLEGIGWSGLCDFTVDDSGVHLPFRPTWQVKRFAGIPPIIWVTGEWRSDDPHIQQIDHNINDANADGDLPPLPPVKRGQFTSGQAWAEAHFAKWLPIGSRIRYLTDQEMAESVRNVSIMLESSPVSELMTKSAAHAFSNLRPAAYRADLWRYMILWAYGGVYLDSNVRLERPLTDWIDFDKDELVLVEDGGTPRCAFWNAMMASSPQNPDLAMLVAGVVNQIEKHFYGQSSLSITGPEAICSVFKSEGDGMYHDLVSHHLKCNLKKVGEAQDSRVLNRHGGQVVAVKVEDMHNYGTDKHYGTMWDEQAVYCDQLEERAGGWSGMCDLRAD